MIVRRQLKERKIDMTGGRMSRLSVASAEKDTNNKGGEDGKGGNK